MKGWISQQEESISTAFEGIKKSIQLVKTWFLDHVQPDAKYVYAWNRFTISESEAIGTSCEEKPSLSVVFPHTDNPPLYYQRTRSIVQPPS